MKSKDITIGEVYAIHNYNEVRGGDYVGYAGRVTAIETHERRVFSGQRSDFGGHRSSGLMVQIERLDGNHEVIWTEWVVPAKVREHWTSYAERKAERESTNAQHSEAVTVTTQRAAALGVAVSERDHQWSLSEDDLALLLSLAERWDGE